jgi:hypothetical protein
MNLDSVLLACTSAVDRPYVQRRSDSDDAVFECARAALAFAHAAVKVYRGQLCRPRAKTAGLGYCRLVLVPVELLSFLHGVEGGQLR